MWSMQKKLQDIPDKIIHIINWTGLFFLYEKYGANFVLDFNS